MEVSVISCSDGVLTTRALGHDSEWELKGFSWLHTAVYHSLEGNGREEEGNETGEEEWYCSYTPRKFKAFSNSVNILSS